MAKLARRAEHRRVGGSTRAPPRPRRRSTSPPAGGESIGATRRPHIPAWPQPTPPCCSPAPLATACLRDNDDATATSLARPPPLPPRPTPATRRHARSRGKLMLLPHPSDAITPRQHTRLPRQHRYPRRWTRPESAARPFTTERSSQPSKRDSCGRPALLGYWRQPKTGCEQVPAGDQPAALRV
jgi:hypothetical protein